MKKGTIYKSLIFLAVAAMFFVACTKEVSDVRLDPQLATSQVLSVTSRTATVVGFVIAEGDGLSERGVCYATTNDPTTSSGKVVFTGEVKKATYTVKISGLDSVTTYYARAYAIGTEGTIYGDELSFTTLPEPPVVTTAAISAFSSIDATGGGEVLLTGGADVSARGVCWSTSQSPTIANSKSSDGTGVGIFSSTINNLSPGTTYYVRAYATNSAGTAYGDQVMFTTKDITKFWVVGTYNGWDNSDNAKYIISSESSSTAEGYVYFPAAGAFKLCTDHSWDNTHTFGDNGAGALTNPGSDIVVSAAGYYWIKASLADMTYSILKTEWGVIGSASPNGWNDEVALTYNTSAQTWEGVIHLTAAEFKFRANHNWDYNYGSSTGDQNLNAGGSNIPVAVESDYQITLNLSVANAYTYTAYRWGLIGSATPGGWDDDSNMTWDAANSRFTVTVNLVVGKIKFRANDDWGVNYGGDINALTAGGSDIDVTVDGNYTITFDPYNLIATITQN